MDAMFAFVVAAYTWFADAWTANPVIVTLAAPVIGWLITVVPAKALRVLYCLVFAVRALRDRLITDKEVVETFWRLVSIIYGFWPNESRKAILKFAPVHWHKLIEDGEDDTIDLLVRPKLTPKATSIVPAGRVRT